MQIRYYAVIMETKIKDCDFMCSLISVIIPVYNVAEWLPRCMESVLAQTHKELDIILVNDGSTDNSGELCDYYANQDSRVRVFHQANAGVSAARNVGLDNAKGDWIGFVDPDDWIDLRMYEKLLQTAILNKKQIACCNNINYFSNSRQKRYINETLPSVQTLEQSVFFLAKYGGSMCRMVYDSRLFKDEVGEDIRFDTAIHLAEDQLVAVKLMLKTDGQAYTEEALYYYFQREQSMMHSGSVEKKLTGLTATKQVIELVEPISDRAAVYAKMGYANIAFSLLCRVCQERRYDIVPIYRREARRYAGAYFFSKEVPLSNKMQNGVALLLPKRILGALLRFKRRLGL